MSQPDHPLSWQHDGMAAGPQAPAAQRGARTAPTRPQGQGILLLIINPGELNAAIMPERFELRTIKRTKYPEPDQLIESGECRDHFTHVDKLLEDDCAFIFKNRDIFSTATNQEKDKYTEALNKILGKILPEPYKKTISPGKNKWISKEQWNIMKMI